MDQRNLRRNERIPCSYPVLMAWTDADGNERGSRGKCRDISLNGLSIDTVETIPAHSYVNLRIEGADVAGSARVRYLRRNGARNIIGLGLGEKVREQLLAALREKM